MSLAIDMQVDILLPFPGEEGRSCAAVVQLLFVLHLNYNHRHGPRDLPRQLQASSQLQKHS
jgi:hypothetical protein